ncbi:MAG: 4-hydroxy-tetrahydrodipicolinate reductase [Dehalococcoidales bacterium]
MTEPVRVVVHGALGKMGSEVVSAVCRQDGMRIAGAVDMNASGDSLPLPDGSGSVSLSPDLEQLLKEYQAEVLVDFTVAQAAMPAARTAAARGINLVIGTTGLSKDEVDEISRLSRDRGIGAVVAPNFALGAVLMMHLARIAGKYLDHAEIIELHHDRKVDAPSGTALSTAQSMASARNKPFTPAKQKGQHPSRGEELEGINIHSIRLPGLLAHQEVILGGPGQTLTIRHDTISRECFMPGVIMAIEKVVRHQGLIYGLDSLLGLEG